MFICVHSWFQHLFVSIRGFSIYLCPFVVSAFICVHSWFKHLFVSIRGSFLFLPIRGSLSVSICGSNFLQLNQSGSDENRHLKFLNRIVIDPAAHLFNFKPRHSFVFLPSLLNSLSRRIRKRFCTDSNYLVLLIRSFHFLPPNFVTD